MSYIGNSPTNVAFQTDTFSGTGSQTAFTMSVAPANTTSVLVAVTGVLQDPSTYSVSGTTLTFSAAPPSGTSNISVRYLGIPASGVTTTAYRTVTNTTATAGQTSFTIPSYTVGYIDVFRNGVYLPTTDYTATTGTTVVLTNAATVGDTITTSSFYVSSVLNALPTTGGTLSGNLIVSGTETVSTITSPAATALTLQTNNGTTAVTVDTSQNVGIGTASPSSYGKLTVANTAADTRIYVLDDIANGRGGYLRSNYSDAVILGTTSGVRALVFSPDNTERMRLDLSGNLLVAKTATSTTTAGAEIRAADGSFYSTNSATLNTTSTYNAYSTGASAYRFYVGMAGTVYATNTAITAISDQRLKENIRDLDDGLEKVLALKPRKFDWKEGKGADIKDARGFIAQEFEIVFPDMVEAWKDTPPEGEEPYKAVNANLIPTLVKAIQEQQALITQLQADVAALKGKP